MRFDRWKAFQIFTAVAAVSACTSLSNRLEADRYAAAGTAFAHLYPVDAPEADDAVRPVALTLLVNR